MPTYRNLSVTLHSQYDAVAIEEHQISINHRASKNTPGEARAVVDVAITALPSSQFWINYICNPYPSALTVKPYDFAGATSTATVTAETVKDVEDDEASNVKYFYFQLVIAGSRMLSWGVGHEEHWRGRAVCGFFDGGTDFEGRRIVEKRGLFFGPTHDTAGVDGFEIRVFRAKERMRREVCYDKMTHGSVKGGGVGRVVLTADV